MTEKQHEAIEPETHVVRLKNGDSVTIAPIRVGALPAFAAACDPLAIALVTRDEKIELESVFAALAIGQPESLIRFVLAGTAIERAALDALTLDDLLALAVGVFRANEDFFTRRVMPALTGAMRQFAPQIGMTTSPTSSAVDTAAPTA